MASETAANSSQAPSTQRKRPVSKAFLSRLDEAVKTSTIEEYGAVISAQSKIIDTILARVIVLDKDYNPVQRLDWKRVQQGRHIADMLERGETRDETEASV